MTLGENAANSAVDALESVEALDGAALKLAGAVSNAVPVGVPRDALSGTWLGHALHPLLTDVVIGSFISATLLDLLGGDDTGRASERLIEVGLVTAAPTVASGLTDWALTVYGDRRTRPVGLVHASANLTASALYAASLAARRRGVPGRARLLSLARGALGGWPPRRSPLVHARSRCQRDGLRRGAARLDDGRHPGAGGRQADQREGGRHARSAYEARRASARAARSLLAPRLRAQRRSGRGRVGHLPLPRLPLQPSRRFDRTRPGDGAATRVRDARERRSDRGQAPRGVGDCACVAALALSAGDLCEPLQVQRSAAFALDAVALSPPAVAVAVEVAVLSSSKG